MQCNVLMPSIFQGIQQQFPEEGERERERKQRFVEQTFYSLQTFILLWL